MTKITVEDIIKELTSNELNERDKKRTVNIVVVV